MRHSVILWGMLAAFATAQATSFVDMVQEEEWKAFKLTHKKQYGLEEDSIRMKIFAENQRLIAQHNQKYERGLSTFKIGLNEFADMLHSEYMESQNGYGTRGRKSVDVGRRVTYLPPVGFQLSEEVDWRTKGAVSEVMHQGNCGSCWAFAATGALEGQMFRKSQHLVPLSKQNLIDCAHGYGNYGCKGGLHETAFDYISDNGGIDSEVSYPYESTESTCRYKPQNRSASDVGYMVISEGDELSLQAAVATVGPVAVAIDASTETFKLYAGGVFYDQSCNSSELNHAVLVVGYGTDATAGNYWLVKNSWGRSWGHDGYFKLARDRDNHCGVACRAAFPLV